MQRESGVAQDCDNVQDCDDASQSGIVRLISPGCDWWKSTR